MISCIEIPRPRKRLSELMLQSATKGKKKDASKEWELIFNRSPVKIVDNVNDKKVAGIELSVNRLTRLSSNQTQLEDTGIRESVSCGIVFKSIGYMSLPLSEELPFDSTKGIIRQSEGRVEGMPGITHYGFRVVCKSKL